MSATSELFVPRRVFNGHTDGSAPTVSGFVKETTGLPKDLAKRSENPSVVILPIQDESGQPVLNAEGKPLILNQMDQWDIERARAAHEKLVNLAAFLNPVDRHTGKFVNPEHLLTTYMLHHRVYDDLLHKAPGKIQEVASRKQLDRVMRGNKVGMLRSVEGVYGEHTLADIDSMVDKGVSIWCFMWSYDNPDTGKAADTTGTPEDTGLTVKGKDFISHLAVKRRVAVDLSHASDQTVHDVLRITQHGVPAIATHSGSREVTNHKRNLPDALALQIAEQGGFIGIPFVDIFVETAKGVNVEAAVDHIEHFAELGIVDHVTLGPDFDGMSTLGVVQGLEGPETAYTNLATAMKMRGFTDKQINGVMFENALRYFKTYLFPSQEK